MNKHEILNIFKKTRYCGVLLSMFSGFTAPDTFNEYDFTCECVDKHNNRFELELIYMFNKDTNMRDLLYLYGVLNSYIEDERISKKLDMMILTPDSVFETITRVISSRTALNMYYLEALSVLNEDIFKGVAMLNIITSLVEDYFLATKDSMEDSGYISFLSEPYLAVVMTRLRNGRKISLGVEILAEANPISVELLGCEVAKLTSLENEIKFLEEYLIEHNK